ncbi:uncharacterized protein TA09440 [Theileria annulata]|uniref:Uncharacterized protein n=1 Tax=Theileria annulata TaxID=5874 RepID=Q4UD71_THEAN|nr:uncharacterized protein TA09440 [Theileria annulata]CAI74968.1 hypothetical protein TA09440 [Theileria annulata]|eukprot:XP_952700.1 hypothetical protein TA09440 [Theileria annulata]
MGKVSIIASLVVGFVAISIICLSVGLIYRNKKAKVDTPSTEIIWSFHLENDSDLKLKGNLDVIDVNILKTENYSVGTYNANVNSIEHEFPTAKLTGWTHTYQQPLMIQKFVVESNEVNFLKVEPISGFTVFNNQDSGDFVTIWHDEDFHHYSPKGQLLSIGPFPFANGDDSINPNDLEIPTKISKPESEVDSTDTELDSDLDATYMIKEPEVEPTIELDSDLDATYMIKEPEPKPLLNNMYPDVLTTGWTLDELDKSKKPDDVSFDTAAGFPSGWHDNSDIVEHKPEPKPQTKPEPKPLLNNLYPDVLTTGWTLDELDKSKKPEPKPLLNNMYPDVLTTGWTLDELDKSKKPEPKPDDVSFDTAAGFPSGWHDNSDIVEHKPEPKPQTKPEPKPLLNNLYPDVLTTGWTLDELDKSKKPEPKPLLNNMYPDVLTTGWTLDELDKSKKPEPKPEDVSFDTAAGFPSGWHDNSDIVEHKPEPKPLLNNMYPDVLTTGWTLDELDKSKKPEPKPDDVSFDTANGFPSGWHDNSDIVEHKPEPKPEDVSFDTASGFPSGWHDNSDIVEHKPEPKPLLNNLYPDVLTTGWTLDELDKSKKPEPKPLLNNMYPDVLTTGWTLDELDKSKKPEPKPLLNNMYPDVLTTGWDANYMIKEPEQETFVNILPEMNLTKEDLVFDLSAITLATEETPYKIIQGNDELNIKKHKVDDVFKKYSCSVTNDRTFKPHIRHFLSNFELDCENVSELELYVGEYDEPLCIRLKDQTGFKTYVHKGNNKWESINVQELNTNILDEHYLLLRDDITMIDFSKKSGNYKFGKYKVYVTEPSSSLPESDPSSSDTNLYPGFKAYIHTIYNDTGSTVDFASVRVHRFKYGRDSLTGFMRHFLIRKLFVYFWEPESAKPIYIRMFAHLGFLNYFGYPHYNLQTDTSMFTYYLTLANFEVNNVLAINLARHDPYDFEGGISSYQTRNQLTVKRQEDYPLKPFRRCVHTLTVDGVNKPFSILKFINEPNLSVDQTKVSSLEAYYHNKHLTKPLLVILNGSVRQKFYKLENNGYVSMDNLIVDLKNTLKYLVYHNYKYLKIDVSKMTNYHYTGESTTSSLPDADIMVSVDEVQLSEFFKFTHSLRLDGIQSKFRLIALDGADITFDDPELTSVDSYFLTKDKLIPLIVVLRGAVDVAYVYKRKRYLRESINTSNPLDVLRRLAHQNFDSLYLKLDQTSSYYDKQQDGFSVTVSNGDTSHQGYTHYVHTFETPNEPHKKYNNVIFLNAKNYFHLKIDESHYVKANVYIDNNKFPSIVSLIDDKGTGCHFIFQNNVYKKAKEENVNTKLSSGLTIPVDCLNLITMNLKSNPTSIFFRFHQSINVKNFKFYNKDLYNMYIDSFS